MIKTLKHSRQRDAIITMLRSRYDHPTADQLYRDLKKDFPKLSLGTVYRNLNQLETMGELVKISAAGSSERFDGNIGKHYHFACEKCGGVDDVPLPVETDLEDIAQKALGAVVKKHSLVFYGICKECLKNL